MTPHKSKTIGKLRIPDKYFFDFLRGSFDGDGSCYSYWDPRWKSSFMFYINFNSGSLRHLEWLQSRLKRTLKVSGRIRYGKRCWKLNFAKREARIIIPHIYYKKDIPCLERKRKKIKVILSVDDKEKKQAWASGGTGIHLRLRGVGRKA